MTNQKFTLTFDALLNVGQMKGAVKEMQTALDGLSLSKTSTKGLEADFNKLKQAVKEFEALAQKDITSKADFSKLEKTVRNIEGLYGKLKQQVEDIRGLSDAELSKMFPKDVADNIGAATKALKDYNTAFTKAVADSQKEIDKVNDTIKKQAGTVSELQEKMNALNNKERVPDYKWKTLSDDIQTVEKELEALKNKYKEVQDTQAQGEAKFLQRQEQELKDFNKQIADAESKLTHLQQLLNSGIKESEFTRESKRLTKGLQDAQDALNNYQNKLNALNSKERVPDSKWSTLSKDIQAAEKELANLEAKRAQVEEKHRNTEARLRVPANSKYWRDERDELIQLDEQIRKISQDLEHMRSLKAGGGVKETTFAEQAKAYTDKIDEARAKIAKFQEDLNTLNSKQVVQNSVWKKLPEDIQQAQADLEKLKASRDELLAKQAQSKGNFLQDQEQQLENLNKKINEVQANLDRLRSLKAGGGISETDFAKDSTNLTAKLQEATDKLKELEEQKKRLEDKPLDVGLDHLIQTIGELTGLDMSKFEHSAEGAGQALETYFNQSLERARTGVGDFKAGLEGINPPLDDVNQKLREAGLSIDQFDTRMRDISMLKSRIQYFFGLNNAIMLVRRTIRSAINTIKELDKAMTETAVVTNYSVGDMWAQLPDYTKRANDLGITTKAAYEAATLYYQQGLKTNEVVAMSNETLKMARIAGLEASVATDRMTNAIRGFNMEINEMNAQRIDDVYSQLAAMSASNVDEISTAMTKVASLAHNAGMEFETTAAFLAQIIETTRESAETAGTALKTVAARFTEVKKLVDEGELKGADEEGEVIDVNKVSAALRTAGIDLNKYFLGEVGLDDIFMELASKWDTLTTMEQRYIATQAAGSRQQSRFIALMSDYARTQELVGAAYNANGAAAKQFAKTQESMQSKLDRLKNAWNQFAMGILNSDLLKVGVDILTKILNFVNDLTTGFGALDGTVGGFLSTFSKLLLAMSAFSALKVGAAGLFAGTFLPMFGKGGKGEVLNYMRMAAGGGKGGMHLAPTDRPTVGGTLGGAAAAPFTAIGTAVGNVAKGFWSFEKVLGSGLISKLSKGEKVVQGLTAGFMGLGTSILAVVAAFLIIKAAFAAWKKFTLKGQIKEAEDYAKEQRKLAEETKKTADAYQNTQNKYKDYNDAVNNAQNIEERDAAIKSRNEYLLSLMKEDATYAQYIKSVEDHGEIVLTLDEEAFASMVETTTKAALRAAQNSSYADYNKNNLLAQQKQQDINRKNETYMIQQTGGDYGVPQPKSLISVIADLINEGLTEELINAGILTGYDPNERIYNYLAQDWKETAQSLYNFVLAKSNEAAKNGDKENQNNYQDYIEWFTSKEGALTALTDIETLEADYRDLKMAAMVSKKVAYSSGLQYYDLKPEIANILADALSSIPELLQMTELGHSTDFLAYIKQLNEISDFSKSEEYKLLSALVNKDFGDRNLTDFNANEYTGEERTRQLAEALGFDPEIIPTLAEVMGLENGIDQLTEALIKSAEATKTYQQSQQRRLRSNANSNGGRRQYKDTDDINNILNQIFNNRARTPQDITKIGNFFDQYETLLQDQGALDTEDEIDAYTQQSLKILKKFNSASKEQIDEAQTYINSLNFDDPLSAYTRIQDGLESLNPIIKQTAANLEETYKEILDVNNIIATGLEDAYGDLDKQIKKLIEKNDHLSADDVLQLAEGCEELQIILEETNMEAGGLAKTLTLLGKGAVTFDQLRSGLALVLQDVYTFDDLIKEVHDFIANFDEGIDYGEGIDFFTEKAKELTELYDNFEFGNQRSKNLWTAMFGGNYLDTWAAGEAEMKKRLADFSKWLENDGYGFLSDPLAKELGINLLDSGEFHWDLTGYEDLDAVITAIADKYQISKDAARSFFEIITAHGDYDFAKSLEEFDLESFYSAITKHPDIWNTDEIKEWAKALGYTVEEVEKIIKEQNKSAEMVEHTTSEQLWKNTKQGLESQGITLDQIIQDSIVEGTFSKDAAKENLSNYFNYTDRQLEIMAQYLQKKAESMDLLTEPTVDPETVDVEPFKKKVKEAIEAAIEGIQKNKYKVTIETEVDANIPTSEGSGTNQSDQSNPPTSPEALGMQADPFLSSPLWDHIYNSLSSLDDKALELASNGARGIENFVDTILISGDLFKNIIQKGGSVLEGTLSQEANAEINEVVSTLFDTLLQIIKNDVESPQSETPAPNPPGTSFTMDEARKRFPSRGPIVPSLLDDFLSKEERDKLQSKVDTINQFTEALSNLFDDDLTPPDPNNLPQEYTVKTVKGEITGTSIEGIFKNFLSDAEIAGSFSVLGAAESQIEGLKNQLQTIFKDFNLEFNSTTTEDGESILEVSYKPKETDLQALETGIETAVTDGITSGVEAAPLQNSDDNSQNNNWANGSGTEEDLSAFQAGAEIGTQTGAEVGTKAGAQVGTQIGSQTGTKAGAQAGAQSGSFTGTRAGAAEGTKAGMTAMIPVLANAVGNNTGNNKNPSSSSSSYTGQYSLSGQASNDVDTWDLTGSATEENLLNLIGTISQNFGNEGAFNLSGFNTAEFATQIASEIGSLLGKKYKTNFETITDKDGKVTLKVSYESDPENLEGLKEELAETTQEGIVTGGQQGLDTLGQNQSETTVSAEDSSKYVVPNWFYSPPKVKYGYGPANALSVGTPYEIKDVQNDLVGLQQIFSNIIAQGLEEGGENGSEAFTTSFQYYGDTAAVDVETAFINALNEAGVKSATGVYNILVDILGKPIGLNLQVNLSFTGNGGSVSFGPNNRVNTTTPTPGSQAPSSYKVPIPENQESSSNKYNPVASGPELDIPHDMDLPREKGGNVRYKPQDTGIGGGGGNDKNGNPTEWKNEFDWLYNLLEDIAELERYQNKLSTLHERYLEDITKTGRDLYSISRQQLDNLETQRSNQYELYTRRYWEMAQWIGYNHDLTGYAQWNSADNTIEINWDAIEAIQDKEFYDEVKEYVDKLEQIQEQIDEAEDALWDLDDQIKEIKDRYLEEFNNFSQRILDAVVFKYEDQIKSLETLNDTLSDTNSKLLDSIQQEIDYSRQIRDNTETEKNIADLEAQLMYARRDTTGGNAGEVRDLEKQLEDARKSYEDTLVDQALERLQENNEKANEQREHQIDLMNEQLEYWKESGALWQEVAELWQNAITGDGALVKGSDLEKLLQNAESWEGMSQQQRNVWANELITQQNQAAAYLFSINAGLYGISQGLYNGIFGLIPNNGAIPAEKVQYASGGMNDKTGWAWLDGTANKPEYVLNASQTEAFMKLADVLPTIFSGGFGSNNFSGTTYIDVNINVDSIASDYDVDRLVSRVKDNIYNASSYRNVNAVSFLR